MFLPHPGEEGPLASGRLPEPVLCYRQALTPTRRTTVPEAAPKAGSPHLQSPAVSKTSDPLGFLRTKGASALPGRPLQLTPLVRTEQAEDAKKVGGHGCRDCSFPGLKRELLKRKMTYKCIHQKGGKGESSQGGLWQEVGSREFLSHVCHVRDVAACLTHRPEPNCDKGSGTPKRLARPPLAP